jgi:hypothetical protein
LDSENQIVAHYNQTTGTFSQASHLICILHRSHRIIIIILFIVITAKQSSPMIICERVVGTSFHTTWRIFTVVSSSLDDSV